MYGALTTREAQVLDLVCTGQSNKEIANSLGIRTGTVNHHLEVIYLKLAVRNRTEAALRWQAEERGRCEG
ncbi:MAG: response regulator transcription factor [Dehalococcoidia bacterium]|nr:response regulator transcription factor [Dehalococcoidia bacterium]